MKGVSFKIQYGVFTTNEMMYSPIDFFSIFINNSKSQCVERKGSQRIDFKFEFGTHNYKCASSILYIRDFDEDYPLCNIVDSFLILIDLEQKDSIKTLKNIISYLITYCSLEKQIYLIGVYKAKKGIKHTEAELTKLCDDNKLLYDFRETNASDYNDVVNSFEEIYLDSFETLKDYKKHSVFELNLDKSFPKGKSCFIY